MRVFVTRPRFAADATAARLLARGYEAVVCPTSVIEPTCRSLPPGPFSAIVATSAHALHALETHVIAGLASLPIYVVGARTSAAARAAGFARVIEGGGDSALLAALMRQHLVKGTSVLYLAGQPRKAGLEIALAAAGLICEAHVSYRTVHAETAPDGFVDLLKSGKIECVLHFSYESARTFCRLVSDENLIKVCGKLRHICLSSDVARGFEGLFSARISVSSEPTEEAMFAFLDQDD